MKHMTEHRPHTAAQHDYIPAFGKDALLPFYDLLTRVLGMGRVYDALVAQADRLQVSDPERASRIWAEIDRLITDRAPWVFTFNFIGTYAVSSRAGNYQYHPQWGPLLDQLWVR